MKTSKMDKTLSEATMSLKATDASLLAKMKKQKTSMPDVQGTPTVWQTESQDGDEQRKAHLPGHTGGESMCPF